MELELSVLIKLILVPKVSEMMEDKLKNVSHFKKVVSQDTKTMEMVDASHKTNHVLKDTKMMVVEMSVF